MTATIAVSYAKPPLNMLVQTWLKSGRRVIAKRKPNDFYPEKIIWMSVGGELIEPVSWLPLGRHINFI